MPSTSHKSQPASDSDADDSDVTAAGRQLLAWWLGCAISLVIIVPTEISRFNDLDGEPGTAWLFDMNIDTTPFAVLFLVLPVFWVARRPILATTPGWLQRFIIWLGRNAPLKAEAPSEPRYIHREALNVCLAIALVASVAAAAWLQVAMTPVGPDATAFNELPPAFHDEYSYLFQAQTFADGRISYRSHPSAARIFDQMHVLNEGYFASRYLPGTSFWLTPFLILGNPLIGQCLATVLIAVLVFLIGRELSCNGVGLLAGLMTALSPGILLFGNLILAHQPTLVGLGLFIYSFLRLQRQLADADTRRTTRWALLSGAGLTFAMLCRPMTAAGVGLPFGIWLLCCLVRQTSFRRLDSLKIFGGFAFPLMIGFVIVAIYNANTTGDPLKSAYQLYTDLFTPRHAFGFNNVEKAKPLLSDRTLEHYDQWAENLDAALAVQNVRNRLLSSWQWTLGLIAVVLLGTVFLVGAWKKLDGRWWLIAAAILSLHAAHVPYWYDGIFHWHYVFESAALWCLVIAAGTHLAFRLFRATGHPWMPVWTGLLIVASLVTGHTALHPFWGVSRLEAGINQLAFSRLRYSTFNELIDRSVTERPALVLVRHDPSDRHIDYISNHPSLEGTILLGRIPADRRFTEAATVDLAVKAFPNRNLYIFDAVTGALVRIR